MFDFDNIYHCYILGLIWGDGYIEKDNKRSKINGIRLETILEDSIEYENIFNKGDIKYTLYKRNRPNRKPQQRISLNNRALTSFIEKYDFINKSQSSPNLMLSEIQDCNRHYWLRGFLDADGCISISNNKIRIIFSGSYEQDWFFIENILNNLKIKYSISRQITKKNHKYSTIHTTSKDSSVKLLNYIYDGALFGLERKYNKYYIINSKSCAKKSSQGF